MQTPNAMRNLSDLGYGRKPIQCRLGFVEIAAVMDRNAAKPHSLKITISTKFAKP